MKKTLKLVGIAVISAATLFVSCKKEVEPIITADNPDIIAKAYPGYNYIAWSPVAKGNTFAVYRDDGVKWSGDSVSNNVIIDYDIENGEEYTYSFYTSYGDYSHDQAYSKVGNKTSVTLKAIKPAIIGENGQTRALDLAYYEGGSYNAEASKDFIVSADNIKVALNSDKTAICIQFPQKTYLNYKVKVYKGNSVELLPEPLEEEVNAIFISRAALKTDRIATYYCVPMAAGEYKVQVTVSSKRILSYSPYYELDLGYAADKIIAKETVNFEAVEVSYYYDYNGSLVLNNTKDVKAVFTDKTCKKVRVTWSPAKDLEWKTYPIANYTVYAYNDDTKKVEKVTEAIKAGKNDAGNDVYYVETANFSGKYVAVLSVNGKYENVSLDLITSNKIAWYNEPDAFSGDLTKTAGFQNLDDGDSYNDDFVITISNVDATKKVDVKYFTFDPEQTTYSGNNFSEVFVSADYVKEGSVVAKEENNARECIIKNVAKGHAVAYQITVSEEGKKDYVRAFISNGESY